MTTTQRATLMARPWSSIARLTAVLAVPAMRAASIGRTRRAARSCAAMLAHGDRP